LERAPQDRVERRLAAIFAGDVAGYSRLMGQAEAGTLARLNALRRELIDPEIAEHKGRIVKTTGDGILIEFPSVVEAVSCAVAVQHGMASRNAAIPLDQRIEFRIGINLGDVIVEDGDIHGDGVNVAARLEALAEPGGICVSRVVRDQVRDKLDIAFEDLGEQALKNIARPVRVFRVRPDAAVSAVSPAPALALPDKPSIAVLPFENMSGDPEQEYFADGMVEDIITGLSRIKWLFVIARNSTFVYKGRAVDVKQIGRELGVRYVLEGSVRKLGNRVRITGQLIDTANAAHVWAERYDRALDDIFALQDELTMSVVGAIEPTLRRAEIERARRKRPDSLDAYDLYLRALPFAFSAMPETADKAVPSLEQAIAIEPDYAAAHALIAWCYEVRYLRAGLHDEAKRTALRHARIAIAAGGDDAYGARRRCLCGRHSRAGLRYRIQCLWPGFGAEPLIGACLKLQLAHPRLRWRRRDRGRASGAGATPQPIRFADLLAVCRSCLCPFVRWPFRGSGDRCRPRGPGQPPVHHPSRPADGRACRSRP